MPVFYRMIALCLVFASGRQVYGQETNNPTKGGGDGKIIWVTNLSDDVKKPEKGSLRWALRQKGVQVIKFKVGGDIKLKGRITIRNEKLTIDGTEAPKDGICIRDGALELIGAEDIILRNLRIRLGPEPARRQRKDEHKKRPKNSVGLDCLTMHECRRVLIEQCSFSESCDELIGMTNCRDVLIRNCLFSDPLSGKKLHPYGDEHGFCLNASASTLRIENSVFAHYVMRGPQFECNDLGKRDNYTVRMEAVGNIMFDYARSGARYALGVEKDNGVEKGKRFEFIFRDNWFITNARGRPALEVITTHGSDAEVTLVNEGNEVLSVGSLLRFNAGPFLQGKGKEPTLRRENAGSVREYEKWWQKLPGPEETLQSAGCLPHDAHDRDVADNMRKGVFKN